MFKKVKNYMDKPVTWGGYWKLCGIASAVSMLVTAAYYIALFRGDAIRELISNKHYSVVDKDIYEDEELK